MNILLSVCGRAGSKGLGNKNIRPFMGWPLILYTLSALDLFKKNYHDYFTSIDICVNSNSPELLEIAGAAKIAALIKRPEELARDDSPKLPVIKYSLQEMEKRNNKEYDLIIDFDLTSPLRTVADIVNIIQISRKPENDIVFSVVNSRRNPYFNMVEENENNQIARVKPTEFTYRQQAPKVYDMNASIYLFKRNSLLSLENNLFDGNCAIYVMRDTAVLDIDHEADFILMEIIAEHYFFKLAEFQQIRDNISTLVQ